MRLHHVVLVPVCLLALAGEALAGPLAAQPAALTFPDVGVGAMGLPQMVTFTNNGNQGVTVSNVTINGVNPGDFTLDFGIFAPPFAIGPGVNFTVSVKFTPIAGGQRSATLTAEVAGGLGNTTVPLTGKAIGQKLTVTPSPINVGGSKLNVPTQTKVTVQNAGGGTVKVSNITLSGANANEFTFQGLPQFPATLGPGGAGAFTVTLVFTPAFQGIHSAALHVVSDDPNLGPELITSITGYGGDPKIATSVGAAAFGNMRLGLVGPPQVIMIQNIGNSGLKVSQLVLDAGPMGAGNPADFVLDRAMIPDGTVIPAMGELPITVTFKPAAEGARSARVVIVSDDPNTPAKYVSLLGNGTRALPAAAPANIDFMTQTLYLASKPVSVTFTNLGNDAYNITKIDFSGANKDWFRVSGIVMLPIKVAPNATVKIDLIALPLGLGVGTASVTFTTDDALVPMFLIPLKVSGVGAAVKVTPAYGDFGILGVLAKSQKVFTIENYGAGALHIQDFRLVDEMQNGCFQLTNDAPMQDMNGEWPTLLPGGKLSFTVTFAPQVEGACEAQIEIDTDDPTARHIHIPLAGAAALAGLKIDPTMLNFGTVMLGTAATPQFVTITNTGGADLNVATVTLSGANPNQFMVDNMGKFTLAAGQSKVLTVSYQPVSAGTHSASLVITPTGFAPAQVKLSGVAVQAFIQVSTGQTPPNVLDFDVGFPDGNTIGMETDALQVGIKVPSNGIAVLIDRVVIAGAPEFRVEQPIMPSLVPGQSTSFSVYFRPSGETTKNATISIFVRGVANALATVTVKGSGIPLTGPPPPGSGTCTMSPSRSLRPTPMLLLGLPALALLLRRRRRAAH